MKKIAAEENIQPDGTDELPSMMDEELMSQLDGSQPYPSPNMKDNIFRFFKHILGLKDSTKVANLSNEEIGKMRLASRSYLELATYAKAEKLTIVQNYFMAKAEIMASTSMGRKGFFLQTSVTQIRKDQKVTPPPSNKPRFWEKNRPQPEGEST